MFLCVAILNLLQLKFVLLSCHNAMVVFTHKKTLDKGWEKYVGLVAMVMEWDGQTQVGRCP